MTFQDRKKQKCEELVRGETVAPICFEEPSAPHCSFSSPQAVGLGLHYVKLGGLSGAERMTKYNRLISIEEELEQQGILGRMIILLMLLPVSF